MESIRRLERIRWKKERKIDEQTDHELTIEITEIQTMDKFQRNTQTPRHMYTINFLLSVIKITRTEAQMRPPVDFVLFLGFCFFLYFI